MLLCTVCLTMAAFAGMTNTLIGDIQHRSPEVQRATNVTVRPHGRALDENIYFENWETGDLDGWTPIDLTAAPSPWHIDDFNAFGGTGTSWWVGDTTNGLNGYHDAEYWVLDSPPVQLPATTPGMVFWHRYSVETPTGPFDPPSYNGWDGCNLRISTNGGATWTVVPSTALSPAYDRTSLYSFGFQHHEGINVPGWCGASTTWHQETVNLSAWAGQNVKLRFAFASDPATSTPDIPSMFGWEVDNIRVYQTGATDTVFSDDCNAVGQWTTSTNLPTGGNLWRIATDASSPAGSHIVVCNNASNSQYNANMHTVLESPLMDTRNHANGTLIADVACTGVVQCDSFPARCDYWGMEVSIDSGRSWCAVSNPTCEPPPAQNFVYTDLPPTWAGFDSSYQNPMNFSALLGNVLKFRFTFQSDSNHNTVDVGPKFDGFTLDYTAGFPNDVTCYTFQVKYPNMVSRPIRVKAYFQNVGQTAENSIPAFFRVIANGQTNRPFTQFSLEPGATVTKIGNVTLNTAGTYTIKAWSQLSTDENLSNDSSIVNNVVLQPASAEPEIGYDNRTVHWRFNYANGTGPLVKFTPQTDSVVVGTYNVTGLLAQYDMGQPGDLPIRYHVYADNAGVPGTSLYNQLITVASSETGPDQWKTVDTHSEATLHNLTGPFWVWIETVSTADTAFPAILGDDSQPWDDAHNYTWNGTGAPATANYFYNIHATIVSTNAVSDNTHVIPAQWTLEQNFPNPFNPTTEIRYSVPRTERMTLKVFNVMGQEVATLVDGQVAPGSYTAHFDASSLSSGVYIYRIESASFSAAHKMLLMK
jgi:hypothetical protein